MIEFIKDIINAHPHGMCFNFSKEVMFTFAALHIWIAMSYIRIPVIALLRSVFIHKKTTVMQNLFAAFIFGSFLTHTAAAINIYFGSQYYLFSIVVLTFTAIVSEITASLLCIEYYKLKRE